MCSEWATCHGAVVPGGNAADCSSGPPCHAAELRGVHVPASRKKRRLKRKAVPLRVNLECCRYDVCALSCSARLHAVLRRLQWSCEMSRRSMLPSLECPRKQYCALRKCCQALEKVQH